ncbi:MAG: response regulator, partial [Lawsonibacter sp.]|nr:response regulator [Lawsonibacter sp.]
EDLIRRGLRFQMDWTAAGCVVADEAASGREGLEKIGLLRPDVVVTDVRMPDMDGLEMLKRGLEVCPFDAIVVSGYGEFDYAQQAIRLGVAEYLLKPVDFNDLRGCIQKIVARRRQRQQGGQDPSAPPLVPNIDPAAVTNRYAARMLRYIQEHYAERISLTDLSQELNVSCTHLNAKFKAEVGYTFHDFLNHYRISRAVELQKQGTWKLYEIAEMVGFSDYKYFNKVYKKYVGYPPNKSLS